MTLLVMPGPLLGRDRLVLVAEPPPQEAIAKVSAKARKSLSFTDCPSVDIF